MASPVFVQQGIMTADEFEQFIELPENEDRLLELIYGEVVEKVPTQEHGVIALAIGSALREYNKQHHLGHVGVEVSYRRPTDNYNTRMPDVSFHKTSAPRVTEGSVPQMPDLAVEIQSPKQPPHQLREKASYYLQNGSKLVWLVYPKVQRVEVCTHDEQGELIVKVVKAEDMLSGGDVLPGFALAVKEIFEG